MQVNALEKLNFFWMIWVFNSKSLGSLALTKNQCFIKINN